jgi:hypothetical protein
MQAREQFWWAKEEGVKYKVEIINDHLTTPADRLLPGPSSSKNAVMIRVLAGLHRGMYALVDPATLHSFDD